MDDVGSHPTLDLCERISRFSRLKLDLLCNLCLSLVQYLKDMHFRFQLFNLRLLRCDQVTKIQLRPACLLQDCLALAASDLVLFIRTFRVALGPKLLSLDGAAENLNCTRSLLFQAAVKRVMVSSGVCLARPWLALAGFELQGLKFARLLCPLVCLYSVQTISLLVAAGTHLLLSLFGLALQLHDQVDRQHRVSVLG